MFQCLCQLAIQLYRCQVLYSNVCVNWLFAMFECYMHTYKSRLALVPSLTSPPPHTPHTPHTHTMAYRHGTSRSRSHDCSIDRDGHSEMSALCGRSESDQGSRGRVQELSRLQMCASLGQWIYSTNAMLCFGAVVTARGRVLNYPWATENIVNCMTKTESVLFMYAYRINIHWGP